VGTETDLHKLLEFFHEQRSRQASHFPAVKFDKVLTFLGTTSLAGTFASVGVCPVLRLEAGQGPSELRVGLRGPLPRPPARGECVTVHLCNLEQYQGFQVKTRPLAASEAPSVLVRATGDDLDVNASHIFTVHHSPYTMRFFEHVPFEEILETVGRLRYALVGVGEQANISPRFVFHTDARSGKLVTYHGDGLALKTYMNLKANRQVAMLALDLDDFSGYAMRGTLEEFQQHQAPEAYDRICQGFAAGNWGKPSRTFRFTTDSWERIAPTAPAVRR
jgi:hypothetical protein